MDDAIIVNRSIFIRNIRRNTMNNWDRMRAGKLYNADSTDIAGYHERGMGLCDKFNRTPIWMKKRKQRILEKMIPSAKDGGAFIFAPFYCEYGVNILFGKGCFVNYKCTFLDCAPIELGDGVWIGANVTIATPCHPFLSEERLPQEYPDGFHDLEYAKPIRIGDGSWICSSATICGGVTIGKNCIVAAGAVVNRDIPDNCIAAGVPARVLRKLDEQDRMNVWDTYMKNEVPLSQRERER
jgi:maltose O-acetyltransferase